MTAKYIIGLDLGTSIVKAVLFDTEGHELDKASRNTPVEAKHYGWSEFDPDVEWREISNAFRDLMEKTQIDAADVAVIGICAKQGTCFLDENNRPVRLATLWNDNRCVEELNEWDNDGRLHETYAATSTWLLTSDRNIIIPWIRENEPEVLDKTKTICSSANWVSVNLTGNFGANGTDMHGIVDSEGKVSRKALAIAGIEDLYDKFPESGEPSRVIGEVTESAAQQCGLVPGIPVVQMGWDAMSSTAGGGAVEPGQANVIIGTSGCILVVTDKFPTGPEMGITAVHNVPGRWVQFIAPWNGTPNSDWFNRTLTYEDKEEALKRGMSVYDLYDEEIANVPPGANGVLFHPYLGAAGERAPFANTDARGNFFGLNLDTTRAAMHRAVYEGMAFSNKHCLDAYEFDIKDVCLTGGGTNSPLWCQMFADIFDLPIKVMSGTEFGANGAAWNAAWAVGLFDTYQEACNTFCQVARTYTPDPEKAAIYADLYEIYKEIPPALFPAWAHRTEFLTKYEYDG